MKTNISLIVISLILLSICVVSVISMQNTMDQLMDLCNSVLLNLPSNPEAAQTALDAFSYYWSKAEKRWQLFAIHEDLDSVSLSLMQARTALLNNDLQTASSACDELLITLQTLRRKEIPTLGNIF